jgi:hypothetical protein
MLPASHGYLTAVASQFLTVYIQEGMETSPGLLQISKMKDIFISWCLKDLRSLGNQTEEKNKLIQHIFTSQSLETNL